MDTREVDIIQEFACGGEKAFRVLYDRYVIALRYFAAKYVTDEDVIEDVVQDAFVALWEKRMEFRVENAVKAYLYKAVRHDCLNLLRHRQVENKYAERMIREGDDSESFLDQILESEIFQAFRVRRTVPRLQRGVPNESGREQSRGDCPEIEYFG